VLRWFFVLDEMWQVEWCVFGFPWLSPSVLFAVGDWVFQNLTAFYAEFGSAVASSIDAGVAGKFFCRLEKVICLYLDTFFVLSKESTRL